MNYSPKLSIITVCFNDVESLKRTHDSLKHAYNPVNCGWEWIVIDGGSTDTTKHFIESCAIPVKFISEPDNGIYDAMNKGTRLASGEYVVYMNAGDRFMSQNSPNEIIAQACGSNCGMVYFSAQFNYGKFSKVKITRPPSYIWHSLPTSHQAIAFKRDLLPSPPYDCSYKVCGDYYLACKMHKSGAKTKTSRAIIAEFYPGGTSTKLYKTLLREAYKVQRSVLKQGLLESAISYLLRATTLGINYALYRIGNER